MGEPCNRSDLLSSASERFEVGQMDCCDAFKQDPNRLFTNKECWYCQYGDFGIYTEHPTKNGICKYKEKSE